LSDGGAGGGDHFHYALTVKLSLSQFSSVLQCYNSNNLAIDVRMV